MMIAAAVLVTLLAQSPVAAQRIGTIAGQVIDVGTGRPVSAAVVSIIPAGQTIIESNPPPTLVTDASGRFAFSQLAAPGSFHIVAKKGGFADGAAGRYRPDGAWQAIELSVAQPAAEIVVRVWKLAAITGTVTDEAGEPVVGMQVRALQRRSGAAGQFGGEVASAMTDDRGVYRLGLLLPGDYLVVGSPPGLSTTAGIFADVARTGRGAGVLIGMVSGANLRGVRVGDALYGTPRGTATPPPPEGTRMRIYPPTFYPAAGSPAQATIVTVASGEERAAIDLHLAPVVTSRVSGMLIGPSGPAGMISLRLVPSGAEMVPSDVMSQTAVSDAAGSFVFPAVVPGSYVLKCEARETSGLMWLASPIVVTGDDVDGLVATLQPPLKITARMQFEGGAPPPSSAGRFTPPFRLDTEDGSALSVQAATAAPEGGVTIIGYPQGRYRVRMLSSPTGWMFKAAVLNGVDVSLTPFDLSRDVTDLTLVFTDRWSGVSGAVQGPRADRAVVILFPTDSREWVNSSPNSRRLRSVRGDAQGRFNITSLPPGDYFVVAISDEQAGGWREPGTLESLARLATQLTILEGEHKVLDLQVREVRQ